MVSKSIVVELNKCNKKLNGKNYHVWHLKIQYVLEEQEALEVVNQIMNDISEGNTILNWHDQKAYRV